MLFIGMKGVLLDFFGYSSTYMMEDGLPVHV